jgi:predicted hexulose-6-phosphate isomerase
MSQVLLEKIPIGIYEKALPDNISWSEKLAMASHAGYDYVELSIDESDERLSRLDWSSSRKKDFWKTLQNSDIPVLDASLSAHRRFPLGSSNEVIRQRGRDIFHKAIDFCGDFGIRYLQLVGYYVYYEPEDGSSCDRFEEGIYLGLKHAEKAGVMLAIENVDNNHVDSITKVMRLVNKFNSPWLQTYPDIGNLTEKGLNISSELKKAKGHIVAVHVKDVIKGEVRRIPFGKGVVDFHEAFSILFKIGFEGPFLIEMWNDDSPESYNIIQNSLLFIKNEISRVNEK